jgi:pimeloyl-ACP methyl ester carboxylesterase
MRRIIWLLFLGLQACMPHRSTDGPMDMVFDNFNCTARSNTLLVFLPGAYDKPQDFTDQGFVKAVRERHIDADIQLVDAHIGYYSAQQIVQRLEDEVVKPARSKGYQKIWFVGISLGGYGTLLYAMNRPQDVDGFFIMAPYMGSRDIPVEIQSQGGLKNWSSGNVASLDHDLWRWLKNYASPAQSLPTAYLGYGASDRFAQPNSVLAQVLPTDRSFIVSGGHDWLTWRRLWADFLKVAPLPVRDLPTAACGVS